MVTKEKIIMKITEIMTGTTNKEYLKEIKSIVLTYLKDEKGLLGSVNDQLAKFKWSYSLIYIIHKFPSITNMYFSQLQYN